MKDGRFETQAEIFKALLDKVKIKRETWALGAYIHLVDGRLADEVGDNMEETRLYPPREFLIYEEPKTKKKVTLYNYTYQSKSGIYQTGFSSLGFDQFPLLCGSMILLTESKEVEYDDV